MNEPRPPTEHIPQLDGLPTAYHRLEQCHIGLGWSTYAQDQAHEQQALQQLYADLLDRADVVAATDDNQFDDLPVRLHDAERCQTGEGWCEYHDGQAAEHAPLPTKCVVNQANKSDNKDA
jgi:hypothetical protein